MQSLPYFLCSASPDIFATREKKTAGNCDEPAAQVDVVVSSAAGKGYIDTQAPAEGDTTAALAPETEAPADTEKESRDEETEADSSKGEGEEEKEKEKQEEFEVPPLAIADPPEMSTQAANRHFEDLIDTSKCVLTYITIERDLIHHTICSFI